MRNKETNELIKALKLIYGYLHQYEDHPEALQQTIDARVGYYLSKIRRTIQDMDKTMKSNLKALEKQGKIRYINKNEYYYVY